MSLFTEPFDLGDPDAIDLVEIARSAYTDKEPLKALVATQGVSLIEIDWEGAIIDVWPRILRKVSQRGSLRSFTMALRDSPDYALMHVRIDSLLAKAAAEEQAAQTVEGAANPADPTGVTLVGRRPFIDRARLRTNLRALFAPDRPGVDNDQAMIVNGPRRSGRSYTWVLISHVARSTGWPQPSLIDLSLFRGSQAKPEDVVSMIAMELGWLPEEHDATAQDDTKARVLFAWLKGQVRQKGPVCLVFDGLDGDTVSEATLAFVGDVAAAAGNGELGDSRVILLAYGRALRNPNVDPFILRDSVRSDIPLADFTSYLQAVAAEAGVDMTHGQALELTKALVEDPPPDPVPVAVLADKAANLSAVVCQLRRGSGV